MTVCRDLSCWLRGAEERIAEIRERYGDETEVEVVEVSCLGRCDSAPAVTVNERPANVSELDGLVTRARDGAGDESEAPVASAQKRRRWPNDPYADAPERERYAEVRRIIAGSLGEVETVEALEESGLHGMGAPLQHAVRTLQGAGLRGMGGAGFPTGSKWEMVAQQTGEPKYVICNADESEPGTFKDRQILVEQAHLVIEGMLVAMLVVGAEHGWVFIRHEYEPEQRAIRAELERARELGALGEHVYGSDHRLEIEIFTSPGGYILGEESALLECMEGHRGEPRNKPPFPALYGLWGKPTLMNSVETFAAVPIILEQGAEWWKQQGVNGGHGLKFFAVSGDVARPDVYCVPMGTTARELIELAGGLPEGVTLQAFQPGGASSNFLGPESLDVPLDFKPLAEAGSMLGSGAVVVVGDQVNLLAAATNVLRFFRNESCGKCVPCRVGSHKAHTILTNALAEGLGPEGIDTRIDRLEETLRMTSICGLGQVALGPVMSVLRRGRAGAAS